MDRNLAAVVLVTLLVCAFLLGALIHLAGNAPLEHGLGSLPASLSPETFDSASRYHGLARAHLGDDTALAVIDQFLNADLPPSLEDDLLVERAIILIRARRHREAVDALVWIGTRYPTGVQDYFPAVLEEAWVSSGLRFRAFHPMLQRYVSDFPVCTADRIHVELARCYALMSANAAASLDTRERLRLEEQAFSELRMVRTVPRPFRVPDRTAPATSEDGWNWSTQLSAILYMQRPEIQAIAIRSNLLLQMGRLGDSASAEFELICRYPSEQDLGDRALVGAIEDARTSLWYLCRSYLGLMGRMGNWSEATRRLASLAEHKMSPEHQGIVSSVIEQMGASEFAPGK